MYLVAAAVGVAAAIRTEELRPETGEIFIGAGGGLHGEQRGPLGTETATATPVPSGPDLIVDAGETHTVSSGATENYRHGLVGGTVRNGGTIQFDGTDS